jgi:hypothetical protein
MTSPPSAAAGLRPRTAQAMFLERDSYRRRRLADISRLLPLIGVVLLLVPLLWTGADAPVVVTGHTAPMPLSRSITYIFAVWAALILAAALFAIAARRWGGDAGDEAGPRPAPSGSGSGQV